MYYCLPGTPQTHNINTTTVFDILDQNIALKGPNTNLSIKDQINNSTEYGTHASLSQTTSSQGSGSLQYQINSLLANKGIKINIDYSDYKPDQKEYETTELKVDKSKVEIDYKEIENKMFVILKSADISLKIDDEEMKDRFTDKEWPEEWVEPTLHFKSKKKKFSLKYEDNSLFTLELI